MPHLYSIFKSFEKFKSSWTSYLNFFNDISDWVKTLLKFFFIDKNDSHWRRICFLKIFVICNIKSFNDFDSSVILIDKKIDDKYERDCKNILYEKRKSESDMKIWANNKNQFDHFCEEVMFKNASFAVSDCDFASSYS